MSEWHKIVKIGNITYRVEKANNKKHKYVAYQIVGDELKSPVRFGAYGMEHYKDAFKQYKELDHNDEKRRELFRKRFRKLFEKYQSNPSSALFWSWLFLW